MMMKEKGFLEIVSKKFLLLERRFSLTRLFLFSVEFRFRFSFRRGLIR